MPWHSDSQISRNFTKWSCTQEIRFPNYFHAKMIWISDDSYDYILCEYRMTATIIDKRCLGNRNVNLVKFYQARTGLNLSFSSINIGDTTRLCARDAIVFELISTHEVQRATCSVQRAARRAARGLSCVE